MEAAGVACELCVDGGGERCVVVVHWRAGAPALVKALDRASADVVGVDGSLGACATVLLELAEACVEAESGAADEQQR